MIDALNALSFDVPKWVPLIGGEKFGFNLNHVARLRTGGQVPEGDLFIANEDEPELITSSRDSTVVVNNKQIINAVVSGVASAVRNVMDDVVTVLSGHQEEGNITIPIYLDGKIYDEILITAKDRINFRSGGRANV